MAVKLGRVNVDAMLRSLTAKQFQAWEHYAQLEPFDETRADYRAASIVQVIANVNRGKNQAAYTLQDGLLRFGEPRSSRRQTWQEQKQIAYAICMAYSVPAKEL